MYDKWHAMIPYDKMKLNNIIQAGGSFCGNNQNYGHISIDYEKVLKFGFKGIREQVADEITKLDLSDIDEFNKYQYLRAVDISLEAAIIFAERYATLAADMAAVEVDPKRKAELLKISDACRRVPTNPAVTFFDAVQAVSLTYSIIMIEGLGTGIGYLRADQYLYSYYKKDIEAGILTKDQALELICLLYIKLNASVIPYSNEVVIAFCGFSLSANITLGGLTGDGHDAVNELSYLFLDAEEIVALNSEDVVVRVHKKTPDAFVIKACQVAKNVRGKIKFMGDETIIQQMMVENRPLNLARGYAITGCNTPTIPGYSLDTPGGIINLPLFLELALNNGVSRMTGEQIGPQTGDPRNFTSFEEIWNAFEKQANALIPICSIFKNTDKQLFAEYAPLPFQSSLLNGPIETGRDVINGGTYPYITYAMSLAGAPNVGDSLAAIKKTVFDDKILTISEIIDALDCNFEGKENILNLLSKAPKFGNDNQYVDKIVNDTLTLCSAIATRKKGFAGATSAVAAASITANIGLGIHVGALPDGRKSGAPLSEGGLSPHQGRNISGPTSTMMSVAKLDHTKITNGSVLNMRFDPLALKSDDKVRKLAMMVRSYLELGGALIQFNIISTETLRKAQKNPEQYRDLLVRVATFTTYFVELSPPLQEDIINRMEFMEL
jgi:formate C-acetyltransferase